MAAGAEPQALRVCETSAVLGHGIPCLYREALASVTVTDTPVEVRFTCPSPRDADEPGGAYATYVAPAFGGDAAAAVTCQ